MSVILTDSGLDKFLSVYSAMESEESGESIEYTNIVVYDNQMLIPITQEQYTEYSGWIAEDVDYTIDGKVIVLTDAGLMKMSLLFDI